MDNFFLKQQLKDNAKRITALVQGVSQEESQWKPDSENWSILEVVNHLYDEEMHDFRVRLDCILHHPDKPWPAIDPQGWVTERKYNERDLTKSLENFLDERRKSLDWLEALGEPDWDTLYKSEFGEMKAGDMFSAWVTHDQLHMRQLVELHRKLTEEKTQPYDMGYAGDW
ncbi:MAG: DinB family protein [Chloroflexi bacterium]|nr:MAG: DinB family protein [Chloroflexota bacterium]MBL1195830.1 DinB family protein [Chloroflexota bacterium]NOH13122.1 DinB family protein [Chloroflexota bacterium]